MLRPPESAKLVSTRLAQLLYSVQMPDAAAGLFPDSPEPRPPDAPASRKTRRIGTWEPREEHDGTSFVRVECSEPWSMWADVERIPPKHGRRVVLLGESVARGFFYDPIVTPAKTLEELLRSTEGGDDFEVVDLARTDLLYEQLLDLLAAVPSLEPDVLVIFAGNNWHVPGKTASLSLKRIENLVRESRSWQPVTAYIEAFVRDKACLLLNELGVLVDRSGIQVVFVIPEFNLLDWRNEEAPPALVGSADASDWERFRREAEESLELGDHERAMELAWRVVDIDEGTTPAGYELLGRCASAMGCPTGARYFLELARDAGYALPGPRTPRCYTAVQQVLRKEAPHNGIRLVDLPHRFAEYLGGELPGRRLFHDYCHLTLEGLRVAMSWTAEEVLRAVDQRPRGAHPPLDTQPADVTLEAQAHLLAAIHNARCGQHYDIVRFHCDQALAYSPPISGFMLLHLDACLRRTPAMMCASFSEMQRRSPAGVKYLSLGMCPQEKDVSYCLIQAMTDALALVVRGVARTVDDLFEHEHKIGAGPVSLLRMPYCSPSSASLEHDWRNRAAHFSAYSHRSLFSLVCGKGAELRLRLALRVPNVRDISGPIRILLNGVPIGEISATPQWRNAVVAAPGELVRAGINTLTIEWPRAVWTKRQRVEAVLDSIARGPIDGARFGFPEIYAVHGQLQTVAVSEAIHPVERAPFPQRENAVVA